MQTWRTARRYGVGISEAERYYRECQQKVREAVERELKRREDGMYSKVLSAPRNSRVKLFWNVVKEKRTPLVKQLIDENHKQISPDDIKCYLNT